MNKIAFCPRMSKTVRRSLYGTVGIISMQPRTIAWFTQELLELKMKSTTYDPTSRLFQRNPNEGYQNSESHKEFHCMYVM